MQRGQAEGHWAPARPPKQQVGASYGAAPETYRGGTLSLGFPDTPDIRPLTPPAEREPRRIAVALTLAGFLRGWRAGASALNDPSCTPSPHDANIALAKTGRQDAHRGVDDSNSHSQEEQKEQVGKPSVTSFHILSLAFLILVLVSPLTRHYVR